MLKRNVLYSSIASDYIKCAPDTHVFDRDIILVQLKDVFVVKNNGQWSCALPESVQFNVDIQSALGSDDLVNIMSIFADKKEEIYDLHRKCGKGEALVIQETHGWYKRGPSGPRTRPSYSEMVNLFDSDWKKEKRLDVYLIKINRARGRRPTNKNM